ncbi:transporter [Flavobacterium sp. RHBU_24]|uniref:transporter n=1 Tax=Flavobacterium sp. RHBU_24 TaxID=3391185 RepID=UPI00398566F2
MKHYLYLLLAVSLPAFAQDNEIKTDRPDQTECADIVPAGRFQMENGFMHTKTEKGAYEMMLPTALSKFGINEKLEVRLTTNLVYTKTPDSTATGFEPVGVGCKVSLWEEKGILPKASVIGEMTLPDVASKQYKQKYLAPQIQLLFQNTVSDAFGIGYNFDMQWDGEHTEPGYEYTISPEYSLTEKLSTFIELYGFMAGHARTDNWADGGFKILIGKDMQLDLAGGYELTAHSRYHRFFETVGFSFRI